MIIQRRNGRQRSMGACIVAAVLLPFFFSTVEASWPDDPAVNLPVCAFTRMQSRPAAVSDGAGGIIVVWQDPRNLGHDIYAQRITVDGIADWTVNGVIVCDATGEQEFPLIVSDDAGGAIIVWEDRRSPVQPDLYAQRIDADGVPQWDPNGILVCNSPSYENQAQMIPDGQGGAIVCWTDGRGTLPDIYAQRVDAAGDTLWTFDGAEVCVNANDHVDPQLTSDGAEGAIISWVDGRGVGRNLYAQRMNASGAPVWTINGIAVTDTQVTQDHQRMIPDGTGGAIITWVDHRGPWLDVYGQRIKDALRLWGLNGVAITALASDADASQAVADGSGGVIVTWFDYRSGNTDIYAQRVNATGSFQWATNGVAVCADAGEQLYPQIAADGFGGAIIAWHDYRIPLNGVDLFARRLNASGYAYWPVDGVAISTAPENQTGQVLVPDGVGGAVLAWKDERSDDGDILAQHVGSNGALGDLVPAAISGFVARPADGGVELVWEVRVDEAVEGFRIYRKGAGNASAVAVNGALIDPADRRYLDRSVVGGNTYWYTLDLILLDGTGYRSQPVAVTTPAGGLTLGQNVPNPFNPQTRISFVLPRAGRAEMAVYDTEGHLVRRLFDGPHAGGPGELYWDGRDERGVAVASGVYFCRLSFDKTVLSRKMVIMR